MINTMAGRDSAGAVKARHSSLHDHPGTRSGGSSGYYEAGCYHDRGEVGGQGNTENGNTLLRGPHRTERKRESSAHRKTPEKKMLIKQRSRGDRRPDPGGEAFKLYENCRPWGNLKNLKDSKDS